MKKIFFIVLTCLTFTTLYSTYIKYPHRIEKNISIPGYRTFDYAFWLHPGQGNKELETLFTKNTLDTLKKYIPEGSVAIDIGAHVGDTSVAYSLVVGQTGKVIAFEPNPSCFEVLLINAARNNNIIPVNAAVTENNGNYTFYYTDPGLCNGAYAEMLSIHPYRIPVQVIGVNFEDWLEKNAKDLIPLIKFIKIDTEGYDRYIIKNISNFLLQYRPVIQTELFIYLRLEEKIEFFELLDSLNYKVVLNAYNGLIDSSPISGRTPFNLISFITYKVPEGSIDLLCIPAEQFSNY
jgi:FkbM family methyltransferase